MDSKPDIVTIMLGTNDAKGCNWDRTPDGVQGKGDLFQQDGLDMIAKFKALPSKPKVFVVLPPPLFPPWPYNMSEHAIVSHASDCFPFRSLDLLIFGSISVRATPRV